MLTGPERIRMLARELRVMEGGFAKYKTTISCTGDQIDFVHNGDVCVASVLKNINGYFMQFEIDRPMIFMDNIASEADSRAAGFTFDDLDTACLPKIRAGVLNALRSLKVEALDRKKYGMPERNADMAALAEI